MGKAILDRPRTGSDVCMELPPAWREMCPPLEEEYRPRRLIDRLQGRRHLDGLLLWSCHCPPLAISRSRTRQRLKLSEERAATSGRQLFSTNSIMREV